MPRPPLPLGTHGKIRVYKLGPRRVRARTNYRGYDGVTRPVERIGRSKADAENRLKEALRDRTRAGSSEEITSRSKVAAVAALWLRDLQESDKALRTKETYRQAWERDLASAVGNLQVGEVTVGIADRVLRAIRDNTGLGSAKHARVVLTGIFDLALRHEAIKSNPIRNVPGLTAGGKKAPGQKAGPVLSAEELPKLREHLRSLPPERQHDLVDLVDLLAATGCRIGELLALDWSRVDLDAGTIRIEGTVIRVPGSGLIVQPHTKSTAGMRTLKLPAWAGEVLRRRAAAGTSSWVFPSTTGTLRDPDNTRKQLRMAVKGTPWEGLHPHAFRHLVATHLDEAGLTARQIADYLGHAQVSMTQDVYMNRGVVGGAAAAALDVIAPE